MPSPTRVTVSDRLCPGRRAGDDRVTQVEQAEVVPGTSARTSRRDVLRIVRAEPRLALRMPVFLAAAVLARLRARAAVRSGDFTTWLRDDSSRR